MADTNLVKVKAAVDVAPVGLLAQNRVTTCDITETITYATGGFPIDWEDIGLNAVDVIDVQCQPKITIAEAGTLAYSCQFIPGATPKILLVLHSATANAEVANAASVTTDFRLTVFHNPSTLSA